MNDQQLAELESERLQTTLEVLERIRKAGAKPDDVELLARELGVLPWIDGLKTTTERKRA